MQPGPARARHRSRRSTCPSRGARAILAGQQRIPVRAARCAADASARSALASRVKSRASDAGLQVAREAVQLHGAIGVTDEYDLGLYLQRALVLAAWLGNGNQQRRRYANLTQNATAQEHA